MIQSLRPVVIVEGRTLVLVDLAALSATLPGFQMAIMPNSIAGLTRRAPHQVADFLELFPVQQIDLFGQSWPSRRF